MLRKLAYLLVPLLVAGLFLALAEQADAKRFGGGRSFGSKPSFSKSYSKPVPPSGTTTNRQGVTNSGSAMRRPGFGGLFGGLLMGGLLGSMLFGGGFMGPNMMDFLIIGLGLFFLMRFIRRVGGARRGYSPPTGRDPAAFDTHDTGSSYRMNDQGSAWDNLRSESSGPAQDVQPPINAPAGFDSEEFLRGAKAFFSRVQVAWDNRDLEDIRQFVSGEVLAEIQSQAEADPSPSRTEIMLINARLLEVVEEDGLLRASAYFDVLLREDAGGGNPEQVREVWHFRRKAEDESSTWILEGIQQLQ